MDVKVEEEGHYNLHPSSIRDMSRGHRGFDLNTMSTEKEGNITFNNTCLQVKIQSVKCYSSKSRNTHS